ncbi:MAG: hypothetical protein H0V87_08855, partial [Chloroflexi bacterium]|nr:hypothetical protein [Chloroflexota bacterium]
LRTPLNAMLGWARLLKDGVLPDEKRVRAISAIERNARNQSALIEDLLDVSRIVAGSLRLDVRPIDLAEIVAAAVDVVAPAAEAKDQRVVPQLAAGVVALGLGLLVAPAG